MSLFSWLFGKKVNDTTFVSLPESGEFSINVVGSSYYQTELESICGSRTYEGHEKITEALLICETDNSHDDRAVRVEIQGRTVGYFK
jgi:hypothetical protein